METDVHPALALLIEAEATPVFRFATEDVETTLAVASQIEPEQMSDALVLRLAHRFADVLIQAGSLDRAATWLLTASRRLNAAGAVARVHHLALTARLHGARGQLVEGAAAVVRGLAAVEACAAEPGARAELTNLDIAASEIDLRRAVFGPIIERLTPHLRSKGAFTGIDAVWRAHHLLAAANHATLNFQAASDLYQVAADLCAVHNANRDEAEALVSAGQCAIALERPDDGVALISRAHRLVKSDTSTHHDALGALVAALMERGDSEGALKAARSGGVEAAKADDYTGYVQFVGITTHLLRIERRYEEAYLQLLGIYGQLTQKFGPAAGAPITALIDIIKTDLGDAEFEALSARLLAQHGPS
ncbi:MAG: tetratricopeptide (TPR) repeat protein [Myxococcota bacterium]|jgi:tetratricopeptide (TPR) repeat protein